MLILEQLILWNKLTYFPDILKIPGLFDVLSRRMFEDMLVEYAKKAVEVLLPSDVSEGSGGGKRGPRQSVAELPAPVKKFYMPVAAPSKKEWTLDSTVTNCAVCGEKFGIVSSWLESVGLQSVVSVRVASMVAFFRRFWAVRVACSNASLFRVSHCFDCVEICGQICVVLQDAFQIM